MSQFLDLLNQKIKSLSPKRIVLIDGEDERSWEATKLLENYPNLEITLLTEKPIKINSKAKVINILENSQELEKYAKAYYELRAAKDLQKNKPISETMEMALELMKQKPFYAMMMLYLNEVDGVVGGLNYPTADILRAAFKVIGPQKGIKTISSVMIMHKEENTYFFSDISVNPSPDQNGLKDIALNTAKFVEGFGIDPKVAFLSFSTSQSAITPNTQMVNLATQDFNKEYQGKTKAIGEVQLDAAIDLGVRKSKYKGESFDAPANVLIFPNLEAGNIGYKLVQRFANYGAIGPIITGIARPVNDLSRGAKVNDIVETVLITAIQAQ
ncbi:phosphate acetyltransferase [Mycoplasmopsis gallinarum]|uniref:Phosphate acetyltransferase n=1 Tax=Mycoplasmopsis gallinarum TaxID=29557 RepID=A0A168RGM8_9BACT|nr:phosphate acetyltransferase [Mycoplasmopsis gallinarum]OAB48967.1 Phosphate acetyltransferase [Mycoplasmopsis gallinarum]